MLRFIKKSPNYFNIGISLLLTNLIITINQDLEFLFNYQEVFFLDLVIPIIKDQLYIQFMYVSLHIFVSDTDFIFVRMKNTSEQKLFGFFVST